MIKEFLKNNEDNIVSIITIAIIIITLIIVVVIWIFNFSGTSNNENLNYYDKKIYSNEMLSEYENEIVNLLNINRVEELYKKADLKFLSDNGLDEDNFKTYLLSNNLIGNSITIVSSECIEYENVYIFRYYYKNYSDYKYVNLIETAPDEYTISFEQEKVSSDIYSKSYFGNNNGVEAEISIVESGNDFIK